MTVASISITIANNIGESEYPCFTPVFFGKASAVSLLHMMFVFDFTWILFMILREDTMPILHKVFKFCDSINECCTLSKTFSCICRNNCAVLDVACFSEA